MHINKLPYELLLLIWSYLPSNMDSLAVISTCKYYKEISYEYGFIKHLKIFRLKNCQNFILKCYQHRNSLLSIYLKSVDTPQSIIYINWPLKVIFDNCYMGNIRIDPPNNCITEELHIIDNHRTTHNSRININWAKFKNLKKLNIYAYDIEVAGFSNCKKLEVVAIDLTLNQLVLSSDICNLKNLKILLVTGSITTNSNTTNMYFKSDKLSFCSINNKCNIITGQNKMLNNTSVNIQGFTYSIFN